VNLFCDDIVGWERKEDPVGVVPPDVVVEEVATSHDLLIGQASETQDGALMVDQPARAKTNGYGTSDTVDERVLKSAQALTEVVVPREMRVEV
jgi:hypothetical protein